MLRVASHGREYIIFFYFVSIVPRQSLLYRQGENCRESVRQSGCRAIDRPDVKKEGGKGVGSLSPGGVTRELRDRRLRA